MVSMDNVSYCFGHRYHIVSRVNAGPLVHGANRVPPRTAVQLTAHVSPGDRIGQRDASVSGSGLGHAAAASTGQASRANAPPTLGDGACTHGGAPR